MRLVSIASLHQLFHGSNEYRVSAPVHKRSLDEVYTAHRSFTFDEVAQRVRDAVQRSMDDEDVPTDAVTGGEAQVQMMASAFLARCDTDTAEGTEDASPACAFTASKSMPFGKQADIRRQKTVEWVDLRRTHSVLVRYKFEGSQPTLHLANVEAAAILVYTLHAEALHACDEKFYAYVNSVVEIWYDKKNPTHPDVAGVPGVEGLQVPESLKKEEPSEDTDSEATDDDAATQAGDKPKPVLQNIVR